MIQQLLQHLDSLQDDLAAIDPAHDIDAADRVAAIVLALRRAVGADGNRAVSAAVSSASLAPRDAA